jgi:hypothetical protein
VGARAGIARRAAGGPPRLRRRARMYKCRWRAVPETVAAIARLPAPFRQACGASSRRFAIAVRLFVLRRRRDARARLAGSAAAAHPAHPVGSAAQRRRRVTALPWPGPCRRLTGHNNTTMALTLLRMSRSPAVRRAGKAVAEAAGQTCVKAIPAVTCDMIGNISKFLSFIIIEPRPSARVIRSRTIIHHLRLTAIPATVCHVVAAMRNISAISATLRRMSWFSQVRRSRAAGPGAPAGPDGMAAQV